MPTLVIFLHQLSATGVARNALAIARHMQEAEWRVAIITVRDGGDLAGLVDGMEHIVLGGSRGPRKIELVSAASRLRAEIRKLAPDVFLSAGNHAHLAGRLATRDLDRLATVYRISNDLAHGPLASSAFAVLSPRRLLMTWIMHKARAVVLVSPHLTKDPLLGAQARSGKARIIGNGVDLNRVRQLAVEPCDHAWAGEAVPIILAVGRMAKQKNHVTLIKAFAMARQQCAMRLIVVGGGSPQARARLQKLVADLGVHKDVAFVGKFENPYPFFKAAKVLVLPSSWEGSPNVLLEALAIGLPVVSSRSAGNAEEILDGGRYGRLVDPFDVVAMSQAILAQLDPARQVLPAMRAEAYDRKRTLAQYQELFDELRRPIALSRV